MIVKIYLTLWAFIAAAAGLIFLTGNFSELTAVVFGFISFGMVFMGMMGVLPATMAHPQPMKIKTAENDLPAKVAPEKNKGVFHGGQVPIH